MATSSTTKPYHGKVMNINAFRPMTDAERDKDFAYGIGLTVLGLIIPLLGAGVAATTGNYLMGGAIALTSLGIALALGLSTRHRILNEFFRVSDASPYVSVRDVTSKHQLDELVERHSIAFKDTLDGGLTTFIYNWLLARNAIEEGSVLEVYRLKGSDLVRWLGSGIEATMDFLVVPYDRPPASVSDEIRLVTELRMVEAGWLSILIQVIEEEECAYQAQASSSSGAPDGAVAAEANGVEASPGELSNKGQALPR